MVLLSYIYFGHHHFHNPTDSFCAEQEIPSLCQTVYVHSHRTLTSPFCVVLLKSVGVFWLLQRLNRYSWDTGGKNTHPFMKNGLQQWLNGCLWEGEILYWTSLINCNCNLEINLVMQCNQWTAVLNLGEDAIVLVSVFAFLFCFVFLCFVLFCFN